MKKIALIGECMIELNGKPFGNMQQSYGGDSLNAAVYLSRCVGADVDVFYVSAMGTDALSEQMIARWKDEGVNTELVMLDRGRQPGLYLIQLDDHGERTFLYWRDQSAARYMLQNAQFSYVKEQLRQMDAIFLSGISLAILPESDRQQLLEILKELSGTGVQIVFDSNFRPALWPQDEQWKTVRSCYQTLLSFCDIALVTFDDEQLVWQDSSEQETLKRLANSGLKKVVLKLGESGCLYQDFTVFGTAAELVDTKAIDDVVDTTSAGDSFNAGFLSGYLTGLKPNQCCSRGNELAGAVIQHKGAIVPSCATQPVTERFEKTE